MLRKKKIMVFAAHPDDEVLGCGGTIAMHAKKKDIVQIVFFTDGESARFKGKKNQKKIDSRKNSAIKVSKLLKVKIPIFNYFPDNQLDTVAFLKVVKFVEKNINKFKPDTIYTHFPHDLNIDHRIVSKAVVTACRPQKKSGVKNILFFEIPSSTEWKIDFKKRNLFSPNWFQNISSTNKIKMKALKIYKKELRKWPHPRSIKGVESLAKWRGATAGYHFAEAFVLGRKI